MRAGLIVAIAASALLTACSHDYANGGRFDTESELYSELGDPVATTRQNGAKHLFFNEEENGKTVTYEAVVIDGDVIEYRRAE